MSLKYRLLYAAVSLAIVIAFSVIVALPGCAPAPQKKPDAKSTATPSDKPGDKPAAKSAEKATEKPAAKPAEPAPKVGADASGMPATPKVSTFAPAEDLASQAEKYLSDLEAATVDEVAYKDTGENIGKQSNTLIVIALALGLHDQDNKFKANAGAIMKAAQELSVTKDLESAKKAVAALKDAAEGKTKSDAALKWEKVAALPELMKQVPIINTKLKLNLKGNKFKSKAKETEGFTAVLAVISQAAMADTADAKADTPEKVKQWYDWSVKARDYAGEVNAAIRAGKQEAADEAMKKMAQNCDDCHAVFHPEAK